MPVSAVLTGLSGWLPPRAVDNDELIDRFGLPEEWITQRTGILSRRHVDPGTATSDLAVKAAAPLVAADEGPIDTVVLATMTPDHPGPATAPIVAAELGLTGAAAFDVGAACAGFVHALATATSLVVAGVSERALVIGADAMSTIVDPSDRNTAVIFGDGAAAALIEAAPSGSGSFGPFDLGSDGSQSGLITIPAGGSRQRTDGVAPDASGHYLHMAGLPVFRQAVDHMSASADRALKQAGLPASDVDWLVAHQANRRILDAVADRLGVAPERRVVHLDRVGNTSAASIPLALWDLWRSGRARPGDRVLLTSFGAGLAWGSTTLRWPRRPLTPVAETE
ncbi:beta-ketoacyl-ACP synthase III [Phytomonospora sp. NPDC050363]|uniref:beta-ketoacyl-ACP synthase III n=1 Tax=Phytomonospora sp. NPDC050363 TaxID=3155642 RepID=UPI0033EAB25B